MSNSKEVVTYAQKLDLIGDKVIQASRSIELVDPDSIQNSKELKPYHNKIIEASATYQECKEELNSIKVPEIIVNEHQDLLKAFNGFVNASEMLVKCIDIESQSFNQDLYLNGLKLIKASEQDIKTTTDKLVEKVLN